MVLEYSIINQKIIHSFAVDIFWLSNVLKIYYFYVVTANDKGGARRGVVHLC